MTLMSQQTRNALLVGLGNAAAGEEVLNTLDGTGGAKYVDKLITTAQVLALYATPIEVAAAPGAGIYREFLGAQILIDYNSAAYAGIASGEDIVFKYTNAAGVNVSQTVESTGFLDQTSDSLALVGPSGTNLTSVIASVANAAIVVHILSGEVTTGNSPLKIRVFYRDIKLTELEAIAS